MGLLHICIESSVVCHLYNIVHMDLLLHYGMPKNARKRKGKGTANPIAVPSLENRPRY